MSLEASYQSRWSLVIHALERYGMGHSRMDGRWWVPLGEHTLLYKYNLLILQCFPLKRRTPTSASGWTVVSIHLIDGFICTYILSWPAPTLKVSRGITGDGAGTTGSTFICTGEHNHQSKTASRLPKYINYMKALMQLTRVYQLNETKLRQTNHCSLTLHPMAWMVSVRWSPSHGNSQIQTQSWKNQLEILLHLYLLIHFVSKSSRSSIVLETQNSPVCF